MPQHEPLTLEEMLILSSKVKEWNQIIYRGTSSCSYEGRVADTNISLALELIRDRKPGSIDYSSNYSIEARGYGVMPTNITRFVSLGKIEESEKVGQLIKEFFCKVEKDYRNKVDKLSHGRDFFIKTAREIINQL